MSDFPEDVMKAAREVFERVLMPDFESNHVNTIARAIMAERERDRWQPIETAPHQRSVWAAYRNEAGYWRTVKAQFVPKFSQEIDHDNDQLEGDYYEEKDAYFWPEGWYEQIENWDDFSCVAMSCVPTHWQPLPPPPTKGEHHDD